MSELLTGDYAGALEGGVDVSGRWDWFLAESDEELDRAFEIDRVVDFVSRVGGRRVALQFPDWLLPYSPRVSGRLSDVLGEDVLVFTLGDTSFGSDCVDEVAALHLGSDTLVHFGPASFAATSRLPVLYVLGHAPMDAESVSAGVCRAIGDAPVVLLGDSEYVHAFSSIAASIVTRRGNGRVVQCNDKATEKQEVGNADVVLPRILFESIPGDDAKEEIQGDRIGGLVTNLVTGSKVVFVGGDGARLRQTLLQLGGGGDVVVVNGKGEVLDAPNVGRLAAQSFSRIEQARLAESFGIVVGTLGAKKFGDVVGKLRKILRKRGLSVYTLLIGKLNPEKLGNFPEIDCFVHVAAGDNALVPRLEFPKPVLTPYECCLALLPSDRWTGRLFFEFQDILAELETMEIDTHTEQDRPFFSTVTGRFEERRGREESAAAVDETGIIKREAGMLVAAQRLGTDRQWTGLDPHIEPHTDTTVAKGWSGIASRFTKEEI